MYHDEIHSRDRENNLNIQKLVGGKKTLEVCLKGIRVNEHFNINIGSLKKVGGKSINESYGGQESIPTEGIIYKSLLKGHLDGLVG